MQADVRTFLGTTDLVKFAAVSTSKDDCLAALLLGTRIIQATTPREHGLGTEHDPTAAIARAPKP